MSLMFGHPPMGYMVQQPPLGPARSATPKPVDAGGMGSQGGAGSTSDYLAQLLNDKRLLQIFPNVFQHMEMILDEGTEPLSGRCYLVYELNNDYTFAIYCTCTFICKH